MSNDTEEYYDLKEEHFGCGCSSMDHVVRLSHYPPNPKKPDPDCDTTIFLTGNFRQWRNYWFPDRPFEFLELFRKSYWKDFWHATLWSRFPLAFEYIFKNEPIDGSVLDAMDFQKKDLDRLYFFLDQISEGHSVVEDIDKTVWLQDYSERWKLRFAYDDIFGDRDIPPEFGVDIQFKSRKVFGRIWHGLKYIFDCNGGCEICFDIQPDDAYQIKGMIIYYQKIIEEIEERQKKKKDEKTRSNTE